MPSRRINVGFYGWRIVLVAIFIICFGPGGVLVFGFSSMILPLTQEFGWSRTDIGFGMALSTITAVIVSPFVGALLDSIGVRRVLLTSTAAFGVLSCMMYFLTNSLTYFYGLYALMFIFGAGCSQAAFVRLVVAWFDAQKGLALGLALSGAGIAAIIAPLYTTLVVQKFGWREAYLTFGAINLLISLPLSYVIIFNTPEEKGTYPDGIPPEDGTLNLLPISKIGLKLSECLRKPVFWKLVAFFFLISLGQQGPFIQLIPVFISKGITASSAASIASLLGVALIVARLFSGMLIDRFYAPLVIAIFLGGCALGYFWMSTVAITSSSAIVCTLLLGMTLGVEYEVIGFLCAQYFGRLSHGKLIGIMFSIYGTGAAISHYLTGKSFDIARTYDHVLMGGAILQVIAVFVILSLGSYPSPVLTSHGSSKATA